VLDTWMILGIIVLLSIDTTLFLQSLISQPIFSCQIIGALVGNYEMGLIIGSISQVVFLGFLPIGGATIPDPQIAPNILVLLLAREEATVEMVGLWIPVMLIVSILFMYLTTFERFLGTWYMKYIPYGYLNINMLVSFSFFIHLSLFYWAVYQCFHLLKKYKTTASEYLIYDGTSVFFLTLFFSLGSLSMRYAKWRR